VQRQGRSSCIAGPKSLGLRHPVGLSAITGARLYTPGHVIAVDLANARMEAAISFGADLTVNNGRDDAVAYVKEVTGGRGADVAIEAVGVPASFELCTQLVRPGGHVANIGVHGKPATLHLESLWIRDITVTTGLVDAYSTPPLLREIPAQGHRRRRGCPPRAREDRADAGDSDRRLGGLLPGQAGRPGYHAAYPGPAPQDRAAAVRPSLPGLAQGAGQGARLGLQAPGPDGTEPAALIPDLPPSRVPVS
jgi:Zinc-binding dehydrogenase